MNYLDREDVPPSAIKKLHKDLAAVVLDLMEQGWRVVSGGHGYKILCRCRPEAHAISIGKTPRNPSVTAKVVARKAQHCPDQHQLLK